MTGTLSAVCAVGQIHHDIRKNGGGKTAIDKRPLDGPVRIEPLGVDVDTQCDKPSHGGPDQALYAYAREDAARWAEELGRDVPPGTFGENLAVQGMPVTDAVIGEQWLIGDDPDRGVLVEVTAPRTPCQTFQAWMGEQQWVKRFTARGDVGAYLRVLRSGTVQAGDPIQIQHRPSHGVTVREAFNAQDTDPDRLRRLLAEGDRLHVQLVHKVRKALDRAAQST